MSPGLVRPVHTFKSRVVGVTAGVRGGLVWSPRASVLAYVSGDAVSPAMHLGCEGVSRCASWDQEADGVGVDGRGEIMGMSRDKYVDAWCDPRGSCVKRILVRLS